MSLEGGKEPGSAGKAVAFEDFPEKLSVLLVCDDPTLLFITASLLRTLNYDVTTSISAMEALSKLRENANGYHIIVMDACMSRDAVEHVHLEANLPVVYESKDHILKGIARGACEVVTVPVKLETFKNLWQHVARKWIHDKKESEQLKSKVSGDRRHRSYAKTESLIVSDANRKNSKREIDDGRASSNTFGAKKQRVIWSVELHNQFKDAINRLERRKARIVPKKILDEMKLPWLTRENVASHLQKFRQFSQNGPREQPRNRDSCFSSSQPSTSSSRREVDLQAPTAMSQNPAQGHVTCQKLPISSTLQYPTEEQVMFFDEMPEDVEAEQLASMVQSTRFFENVNMQAGAHGGGQGSPPQRQMVRPPQPRGQMLNETTNNHIPQVSPSPGRMAKNVIAEFHGSQVLQNSVVLNRGSIQALVTSIPHGNTLGMSNLTSTYFQDDVNLMARISGGFMHRYDSQFQNTGSSSWASVHQGNYSGQGNVTTENLIVNNGTLERGKGAELGNPQSMDQNGDTPVETSSQVDTQGAQDPRFQITSVTDFFTLDDYTAMCSQQQGESSMHELRFEGDREYSTGNTLPEEQLPPLM